MRKPQKKQARPAKHRQAKAPWRADPLRFDVEKLGQNPSDFSCFLHWSNGLLSGAPLQNPRLIQRIARLIDIAYGKNTSPIAQLILELSDRLYECKPEELNSATTSWLRNKKEDYCCVCVPHRKGDPVDEMPQRKGRAKEVTK